MVMKGEREVYEQATLASGFLQVLLMLKGQLTTAAEVEERRSRISLDDKGGRHGQESEHAGDDEESDDEHKRLQAGERSERWAIMRALIIANHPRMKAFCPGETAAWPMNKQNVMRPSANLHTTHKTRARLCGA